MLKRISEPRHQAAQPPAAIAHFDRGRRAMGRATTRLGFPTMALAVLLAAPAPAQEITVRIGISAGYFNAVEKNLPITIVSDRVSTPIGHNLMIRPDLKDQVKEIKDLKGKVIASNGTGSVSTYEVGKILEKAGLTINDVEIKVVPFPQMSIAFANKAIDGAIVIPPF